jgi:hypothetical protein
MWHRVLLTVCHSESKRCTTFDGRLNLLSCHTSAYLLKRSLCARALRSLKLRALLLQ